MMRILGIVCGAAIAVALLTWLVGVPQFTSQRSGENGEAITVVALPSPPTKVASSPTDEVHPAVSAATAAHTPPPAPDETPEPVEVPEPVQAPEPADVPEPPETGTDLPAEVAVAATPAAGAPLELPDQWYAFWSPFRSEIAANGFVAELQRVTGLDYRVVKVKPGVYEVAFSYADDEALEQYLSTISAATGLDLPDGP